MKCKKIGTKHRDCSVPTLFKNILFLFAGFSLRQCTASDRLRCTTVSSIS